jgi:ADP-heptose:LPS heptosyltransferase
VHRKKIFRFFDRYFGIPIVIVLALFTRKKRRLPIESIRNILFIKLAAIGDAILLIPTLRKLKQSYPRATLTFMCSDINMAIIEKIPYVDKIINCRVYDFLINPPKFIRFVRDLRKTKYEVVIDAGQWERINAIITCFTRRDYSIGFKTKRQWKHVINDAVVDHSRTKHELENFMDLLIPLGLIPFGRKLGFDELQLEFFLTKEDRQFRDSFWIQNRLEDKTVICFHPGCGENGKPREWKVENYIEVGQKLHEFDNNLIIIITGTKLESELCNKLFDGIKEFAINTAGRYTLEQTAALVERAKLMVCSNTGILHISTCVGTKTIGLHGPTNPIKWGAYSKEAIVIQSDKFCSPCLYLGHDYGCNEPTCMLHITPDEVYMAARRVLQPEMFLKAAN